MESSLTETSVYLNGKPAITNSSGLKNVSRWSVARTFPLASIINLILGSQRRTLYFK